jgi:hypothetical protein
MRFLSVAGLIFSTIGLVAGITSENVWLVMLNSPLLLVNAYFLVKEI